MISSNLPSNLANQVAAFTSVGQRPIGEEDAAGRNTPLKPVEQLAESGRQQLRSRSSSSEQYTYSPSALQRGLPADSDADSDGSQISDADADSDDAFSAEAQTADRAKAQREARNLEQEQRQIASLAARDREVRAHEQAHASTGGQYAGAANFQYERGPDGVRYAVAGEVPIEIGREPTPEATINKAEVVKRAALAPAEPSPQDRRVAAEAARLEAEARQDLAVERARTQRAEDDTQSEQDTSTSTDSGESAPVNVSSALPQGRRDSADSDNTSLRPTETFISSRLSQTIASTSLQSREPGSILDQLV